MGRGILAGANDKQPKDYERYDHYTLKPIPPYRPNHKKIRIYLRYRLVMETLRQKGAAQEIRGLA
jgi:hypothetical protein